MPETHIPPAMYANWAEDLACDIIAAYCGKPFAEARREIAGRLRCLKTTCDEAALARIRVSGLRVADEQWDVDREQEGGAQ